MPDQTQQASVKNYKPSPLQKIAPDVVIGDHTYVADFVNLYGCTVGSASKIGPFVEIQRNARVGDRCKISSHTFICEGVTIEDEVFVGHGVIFVNDKVPRAANPDGSIKTDADWELKTTLIKHGASIGSGAVIMCDVTVGARALIGAGAVVTRDVPDDAVVMGNPARAKVHG